MHGIKVVKTVHRPKIWSKVTGIRSIFFFCKKLLMVCRILPEPGAILKGPGAIFQLRSKCDPTQVNEADVVRGSNWDFAVNVFYRNQESFWHKTHIDTIFHSKDMRKTKLICKNFKNSKFHVLLHPNQKLAFFVLYLKIINTFSKNDIYTSYSKLSKELKGQH